MTLAVSQPTHVFRGLSYSKGQANDAIKDANLLLSVSKCVTQWGKSLASSSLSGVFSNAASNLKEFSHSFALAKLLQNLDKLYTAGKDVLPLFPRSQVARSAQAAARKVLSVSTSAAFAASSAAKSVVAAHKLSSGRINLSQEEQDRLEGVSSTMESSANLLHNAEELYTDGREVVSLFNAPKKERSAAGASKKVFLLSASLASTAASIVKVVLAIYQLGKSHLNISSSAQKNLGAVSSYLGLVTGVASIIKAIWNNCDIYKKIHKETPKQKLKLHEKIVQNNLKILSKICSLVASVLGLIVLASAAVALPWAILVFSTLSIIISLISRMYKIYAPGALPLRIKV